MKLLLNEDPSLQKEKQSATPAGKRGAQAQN